MPYVSVEDSPMKEELSAKIGHSSRKDHQGSCVYYHVNPHMKIMDSVATASPVRSQLTAPTLNSF